MKLTEKAISPIHHALVYGWPGSGKSELVGRLAEYKNLLWIDMDGGWRTLLKFPTEWKERIDVISLPDTKTFPIAIETCLKLVRGGVCNICEEHGKVGCPACTKEKKSIRTLELNKLGPDTVVVWDPISQLSNSAISHITKNKEDEYKLQTDDWGSLSKLMFVFLSHIQRAPYSTVCISHEVDTEKDEKAPEKLAPVAGSRNTSKSVSGYFDEVIRAEIKNGAHKFYSSSLAGSNFISKSRTGFRIEDLRVPSLVPLFCPEHRPSDMPQLEPEKSDAQKATADLKNLLNKVK